jgi:hypothetical protein
VKGVTRIFAAPSSAGVYAFAVGPLRTARLRSPAFRLTQPANLMFYYYKATRDSRLTIYAQAHGDSRMQPLFRAPLLSAGSRRWFREARTLPAGDYDSVGHKTGKS